MDTRHLYRGSDGSADLDRKQLLAVAIGEARQHLGPGEPRCTECNDRFPADRWKPVQADGRPLV